MSTINQKHAKLIALLMVNSGTPRELTVRLNHGDLCSDGARSNTRKFLEELHDVGVVYIQNFKRKNVPIYAMQPTLFQHGDAK